LLDPDGLHPAFYISKLINAAAVNVPTSPCLALGPSDYFKRIKNLSTISSPTCLNTDGEIFFHEYGFALVRT
jgi:hypothetical protein